MIKKIFIYVFVFMISCILGAFTYELPKGEGIYEEYIYENPVDEESENFKKAPMPEEGLININTATAYELTALPGIGEKMAGRIFQFRIENGGFEVKEDILRVQGIGEKTFEKIKDMIILK